MDLIGLISANTAIVVCFILGIILLIIEAFMPGFGVAGGCGIALGIASVVLTYLGHGILAALLVLLVFLMVLAIAVSMSLRSVANGRLSRSRMILKERETDEAGYRSVEDMQVFVGREGVTSSVLRPTGIADFDGVRLNVCSEGDFIQPGQKVRIIRVEGSRVLVKGI